LFIPNFVCLDLIRVLVIQGLINDIVDKIIDIIMSTEKNNDIVRKRQEDIDAKGGGGNNEIEETLNTVSYKDVKESKKEAKVIGDSDRE
jgi:hypothetical protein